MQAVMLPGQIRTGLTRADRIDSYLRVLHALMLRDMRTRFMGSYWGYLIQVLWPVVHMFIIAGAMALRGAIPPICDSMLLFLATGAVPVLAFRYISREVMKGVQSNKPLTYYPQVKMLDVIYARMIVEIVSSFMGVIVVFAILIAFGIDPLPVDVLPAISGYLCGIMLGIGFGSINATIVLIFPGWSIGYIFVSIGLYIASGVMFLPNYLPDQVYSILKWNPVLQIVEWVRLGYDPLLPVKVDYIYTLLWCGGSLAVGLTLERTVGRRLGF